MTTSTAKWQAPERTVAAKAVFEKAEADLSANPDSYRLEPESVVRLLDTTGVLEKIGENDWQDALEVFMSSARDDANLNALGKRSAIGSAFARLNARASMNTWYEHNAPSGLPRTQAPIFIIGGWRTGTTLLQRLLASAPGLRGLYPYELSAPWKVAGADESARNKLAAGAAKAHERLHFLNSRINSISGIFLIFLCDRDRT